MLPEWPALVAILIWASLAAVSGGVLASVPASTLVAVSLGAAAVAFAAMSLGQGRPVRALIPGNLRDFTLGAVGIGGYHAALFASFSLAPVLEANLLNDTWPLLTVLLAAPLAGETLTRRALGAALLGLVGSVFVVGGGSVSLDAHATLGYALAATASVIWALFTNLLKRFPLTSAELASGCAATAILATLLAFSRGDAWPHGRALVSAIYLGALPIALATLFWEAGVRRGRVMVVGALAYLAPLLSTIGVWLFLGQPLTTGALVGGALIVAGAAIGASSRTGS